MAEEKQQGDLNGSTHNHKLNNMFYPSGDKPILTK